MIPHELLGRPGDEDVLVGREILLDNIREDEALLHKDNTAYGYYSLVGGYWQAIAYHHLNPAFEIDCRGFAERASDVTEEYFTTSWWGDDEDERIHLDKTPGNDNLEWLNIFSRGGQLMLMLDDRRHQLTSIRNWVECWMEPDYEAMAVESLRAKLYISIAASFRTEPLEGLEEMEARFAKSRKKQPKLLFQAWDAARRGDQATFDKNIVEAIKNFEKRLGEIIAPWEALAFDASVVLAAGRALGMKLPEMEPRIAARVITAESAGLR